MAPTGSSGTLYGWRGRLVWAIAATLISGGIAYFCFFAQNYQWSGSSSSGSDDIYASSEGSTSLQRTSRFSREDLAGIGSMPGPGGPGAGAFGVNRSGGDMLLSVSKNTDSAHIDSGFDVSSDVPILENRDKNNNPRSGKGLQIISRSSLKVVQNPGSSQGQAHALDRPNRGGEISLDKFLKSRSPKSNPKGLPATVIANSHPKSSTGDGSTGALSSKDASALSAAEREREKELMNPLSPRVSLCDAPKTQADASDNSNPTSATGMDSQTQVFLEGQPLASSASSDPSSTLHSHSHVLNKKTSSKAYVCSLFRDEEGYLAEFVAFYKVLGVDHIIAFDHYSGDNYQKEVSGWVNEGFLTIRNASELEVNNTEIRDNAPIYWKVIAMKRRAERLCMEWGIAHGYDYHISADLDEYMFPAMRGESLVDTIDKWFNMNKKRAVLLVPKSNFNPSPHLLEPIDLLTIEAYLLKYEVTGNINFHMTVQPKVVYRIGGGSLNYTSVRPILLNCCAFHGCEMRKRHSADAFDCGTAIRDLDAPLSNSSSALFNYERHSRQFVKYSENDVLLRMHHYARSLEKHYMKGRTWMTASQSNNQYDLLSYFHRTFGWTFDDSALRYACAMRTEIELKWGSGRPFLRPGDSWFRNPEFGRSIESYEKRGRGGGRANVKTPHNPHHYERFQKRQADRTVSFGRGVST